MGGAGSPFPDPADAPRPRQLSTDERPSWGLGDAAVAFLASFVLAQLLLALTAAATGTTDLTLPLIAASLLGSYVGLTGGTIVASRQKGTGSLREDFGLALRRIDVPLGIVAGLVSTFLLVPLVSLPVERLFPDIDLSEEARELTDAAQGWRIVVLGLLVAVCTPVVEELFFRGLLQRSLLRRFAPPVAIGLSAILFGLAHLQLPQLPALIALGVVLGTLAWRTGRLGPAIVAHVAFNAATVVFLALER